ncbi:MAG: RNA-binding transcriptional accessory protein [Ruminococcaceae bacterium]|nr:RNA-binding transcriptional accessory protein [Oscillospiraceae bacterium]
MDFVAQLAAQFSIKPEYVKNILTLIDDGNTIPFIARYRKEMHGTQNDQTIRELADRYEYLQGLEKRREEVRASIENLGVMTDEISAALGAAATLAEIEDIYRPYKPKRKTRASVAKEKGLQPLADAIFAQEKGGEFPIDMAQNYVDAEKGVETAQDALQGALDIIAEAISDNANIRKRLRYVAFANGSLRTKASDPEADSVYTTYYDYSEPLTKVAGHRVLAVDRGEREGFLKVSVEFDKAKGLNIVYSESVIYGSNCTDAVIEAATDAYDRLIFPSIERELRSDLTATAAEGAIKNFSQNLRQLLMQPPVKGKTVIGLDPGYRTGCKVAVVDDTGRVLDTGVIYPAPPYKKIDEARRIVGGLIKKHNADALSIGNGTASKETEMFASDLLHDFNGVSYMVVSEAGASVYSASKLAAEEFPEYDVSLRSAVSIARRLQDPLAELVKIDPKAIGVGQYQHDMPPKRLDDALGGVVEECVNSVGVDLNTASPSLLARVAGVSAAVSKNIVAYREENGAFKSRSELKKVPKLGPKAFEQCAGFLRVAESSNVLDNTAVHPESYSAAKALLELCGYKLDDVKKGKIGDLKDRVAEIGEETAAEKLGIGVPTLNDIVTELMRPGRDPRDELPKPLLRTDVLDMNDLVPGMELDGTVRNVIDFGAFVDIGVHQDGLVHISQICNHFIKHPSEKLKVGDVVKVWVLSVDTAKKRISLTMKGAPDVKKS